MSQPDEERTETERAMLRANATHILKVSHVAEILQEMNRALLKGRGWFDEYDSGVLFKWGTGYTRRHIWVDIQGDRVCIRLRPHRACNADATPAVCDGEYHCYGPDLWNDVELMKTELKSYYDHPVAETSED